MNCPICNHKYSESENISECNNCHWHFIETTNFSVSEMGLYSQLVATACTQWQQEAVLEELNRKVERIQVNKPTQPQNLQNTTPTTLAYLFKPLKLSFKKVNMMPFTILEKMPAWDVLPILQNSTDLRTKLNMFFNLKKLRTFFNISPQEKFIKTSVKLGTTDMVSKTDLRGIFAQQSQFLRTEIAKRKQEIETESIERWKKAQKNKK